MENLEKLVLSVPMLYPESSDRLLELVDVECFTENRHVKIFNAIKSIKENSKVVDLMSVITQLKSTNDLAIIGGAHYLSSMANVATDNNYDMYCLLLVEAKMRRKILELASEAQESSLTEESPFDIIAKLEGGVNDIMNNIPKNDLNDITGIKNEIISKCKASMFDGIKTGVMSSIDALNKITNGWQPSDLIILAGRPGMGKTSAALDFVLTPSMNGIATAFFSLEMSKEQLGSRALSVVSSINVQKIVNKNMDTYELQHVIDSSNVLDDVPLFIDDTPSLTLFQLRIKAKKLKRDKDIKLIVIDYLQLMNGDVKNNANREQEISKISRGLKALAKEMNIPIIALSQLSRECEKRADKKPLLSDLRESGAIEQDADMIIFLLRPEYYGIDKYYFGNEELHTDGLFMFLVSKFRNGSTGEIKARWIAENTMICNW